MNLTGIVKSIAPFKKKTYLPIINRRGKVFGRLDYEQCLAMRNCAPFTLPVVRIIVLNGSRFLLKERPADVLNGAGKIDTPFERYVLFREEIDDAARRTLHEQGADRTLTIRFLFHYLHRTKDSNRLVYLYLYQIRNEQTLAKIAAEEAEWWTVKRIRENLNCGVFPEYFEKEFELFGTTLLKS